MSGGLELLPNTRQVRDFYCHARQSVTQRWRDHSFEAEFDAWLAAHDAEVAARALSDIAEELTQIAIQADAGFGYDPKVNAETLRARAAEHRKEVES